MDCHTSTPWKYAVQQDEQRNRGLLCDADGYVILDTSNINEKPFGFEDNHAFIVRAVNCHDDLVKALETAISHLPHSIGDVIHPALAQARAALAKAKG